MQARTELFVSPNADRRIMKIWNYITFFPFVDEEKKPSEFVFGYD